MIKPEQIPKGLALLARTAFHNATGPTTDDDWNAAIAAALNAWPDMEVDAYPDMPHIILPLSQEPRT